MESPRVLQLTANIVAAFASHNHVRADLLPGLIASVFQTLSSIETGGESDEPREPAVPVRTSVKSDHLVCLECGAKFASLRRHLKTSHDLTPDRYRENWGLRPDYPMVAPSYSARRSEMAKRIGLGARRQRPTAAPMLAQPEPERIAPPPPPPPPEPPVRGVPARVPGRRGRPPANPVQVAAPPALQDEMQDLTRVASSPAPVVRSSPTAESVFANFPRQGGAEAAGGGAPDPDSEEAVTAALVAKGPRRKPFAKQPARGMRSGNPRG